MFEEIYLDNCATTRAYTQVADRVRELLVSTYGNPSSIHAAGFEAEKILRDAREKIASTIKAAPEEIIFTSGGTESDNLAIKGGADTLRRMGNHIIITAVEHPAVSETAAYMKSIGYEVTVLPVDSRGIIDTEELESAITEHTILVSMMYVNNETGAVMPIEAAGDIIKKKNPKILFHVDAVQAYGKYRLNPAKSRIDLMSVSGHKLHGPKGTGFLYVKKGVRLSPQLHGGGQQGGLRSGTENMPGIAGLALAAELSHRNIDESFRAVGELKEYFAGELNKLPDVIFNSPGDCASPYILNCSFPGIRGEVMVHALESDHIYVSSGSACASHKVTPSPTLTAMGLGKEIYESAIRFSFSEWTKREELDYTLECIKKQLAILRRYKRK